MSGKSKNKFKSFQPKRKHPYRLEPGLSGFLCTCNGKTREKDCVRESYSILNQFADKIFGPEGSLVGKAEEKGKGKSKPADKKVKEQVVEEEEEDIDEALKREVESINAGLNKKPQLKRFQVVESGANGVVFIRSTVPDPVKLAYSIVTTLSQTQQSKYLLRLLPVEITCKAYLDEICSACEPLFDKHFSGGDKTFAIVYNHRNNDSIKREELIDRVAELVCKKNDKNKTDLKNPQLAILVEVIRNICCISVVPEFYTLKKYNVLELATQSRNPKREVAESKALEEETQV